MYSCGTVNCNVECVLAISQAALMDHFDVCVCDRYFIILYFNSKDCQANECRRRSHQVESDLKVERVYRDETWLDCK